jgi:hypothetical protein
MIKMFKSTNETLEVSKENIEKYNKKIEAQTTLLENNRKKKHELQEFELRLMRAQGKSEEAILKRALAISKENQQEAYKQYELKRTTLEMHKNIIATYESTQADLDKKIALEEYGSVLKVHYEEQKKNNARELVNSKEQLNASILANNAAVKVVNEANAQFKKSKEDLIIFTTQKETDAKNAKIAIKKDEVKQIDKIDTTQKDKDEQRVNQAKTLLEKATKEQEDLLADTNVKQENLLNERNKKEYEKIAIQKDRIAALELEAANHIKRLEQAVAKDKEIQDQKDEAARVKKRQDIEDDNEVKLNAIRQEKNDNLDQQREYAAHLNTLYESQKASGVVSVELEKEIAEQKKLIAKTEQEYKEYSLNKGIEVAGQAGQLLQQIAGNSKEAAIGGIVLEKAASIASIIASTFATNAKFTGHPASILSFGGAAALPVALNTASGAIGIASIIAQASKSISEINGAKSSDTAGGGGGSTPSKFATGGLVTGMGTSTSDSIMANLSNGESVINAKSTAMFGNLLSNINQMGGGVSFGNQNQTNPIFKTYVVASEMTSQIEANLKLKQIARL